MIREELENIVERYNSFITVVCDDINRLEEERTAMIRERNLLQSELDGVKSAPIYKEWKL